jgi:hypothetical protein
MAFTPTDPLKAEVRVIGTAPNQSLDFYIPRGPKGDPGGITSTILAAGTNLDSVITAGAYSITSGVTAGDSALANLPMHEAGSLVVTMSGNNSVQIQTYTTNTKSIYVRRRFSGSWNPWRHFGTSRTDQTAGRVMYSWDEVNQREQLTYGDTGWRDVSADLLGGATGTMRLRRVGNVVDISMALSLPEGLISGTMVYALPLGFRSSYFKGYYGTRPSGNLATCYVRPNANNVYLGLPSNWSTSWGTLEWTGTFTVSEAWPTTLPGTALGSIPIT